MQAATPLGKEDRADVYALLATLLLTPDAEMLRVLAQAPPCPRRGAELIVSWDSLRAAAARCRDSAAREFQGLFLVPSTSVINPYARCYVPSCMTSRPLANLRGDLYRLGLQRNTGVTEVEDHLGALCEVMRMLILQRRGHVRQQEFFLRHLAGWAGRCLDDIAAAPGADFFRAVAGFGRVFFGFEAALFGRRLAGAEI